MERQQSAEFGPIAEFVAESALELKRQQAATLPALFAPVELILELKQAAEMMELQQAARVIRRSAWAKQFALVVVSIEEAQPIQPIVYRRRMVCHRIRTLHNRF